MKAIRALAASCTLLIASFAAHILAGGATFSPHSALAMALTTLLIALVIQDRSSDPISVTLAIFAAQNAGHFILGGGATSDTQMFFSHFTAGLVSYHLLRYFDRNLPDLGRALLAFIAPVLLSLPVPVLIFAAKPIFRALRAINSISSRAYSLRGPPLI